MDYTFAVYSTVDGLNTRAKSVIHVEGDDIHDIMRKVVELRKDNPQLTFGAALPGKHLNVP